MKQETVQHSSERAVARERSWAARGFWFLVAMLLSAFALLMKFLGFFLKEDPKPVEAEDMDLPYYDRDDPSDLVLSGYKAYDSPISPPPGKNPPEIYR